MSATSRAWKRIRRDRLALVSGSIIVALMLLTIVGPLLRGDEHQELTTDILVPPGAGNLLGTDELGRSLVMQLILGVQTSLLVGLAAAFSATALGVMVGAIAGFASNAVGTGIMRVAEIFQAMPTFILAAVVVALSGPGTTRLIVVIALLSWPQTARLMYGQVLRVRALEFVDALRCLGIPEWRILWFEVVPNAVAPVIALGTLIIGQAILLEAALAFFGLSAPDIPSWGRMLSTGQRFIYQAWWLTVFPGVAIIVTVLAFNLFGDCVTRAFNPRASEN